MDYFINKIHSHESQYTSNKQNNVVSQNESVRFTKIIHIKREEITQNEDCKVTMKIIIHFSGGRKEIFQGIFTYDIFKKNHKNLT